MKSKILSFIIAFAMVFSTAAVSFAGTTGAAAEKVRLDVTSGGTDISVVATEDYVVTATVDTDGTVNKNEVSATLTMTNVAGLGIEGTRSESYTLTTGLGDSAVAFETYLGALADFRGVNIEASVNDKAFAYEVKGSLEEGKWVAEPKSADAVSAAWQELTSYVITGTAAADSNIAIKAGTMIQVGNEILTFEEDLTVQDLNAQGDNMTGQILAAVTFEEVTGCEGVYCVYLPAGSALQISESTATLASDAFITLGGLDLENISFKEIKDCANARDAEGMIKEALALTNGVISAVNEAETVTVDIEVGFNGVYRVYGDTRIETSMQIAETLKILTAAEEFENVIIGCAHDFPDALAGSYLAAEKNAPILLIDKGSAEDVVAYVKECMSEDGTVYVLGGTGVVPEEWLGDLEVTRLAGDDRYATNLAILEEVGVEAGTEVLVCTGTNFPDSLAASATGAPILMVGKSLTEEQKAFIEGLKDVSFTMIGGTSVVSAKVEAEIAKYGKTDRLYGKTRFETSVKIAERYCADAETAILAYGMTFPDGLCGGPLAYAMGAPLLLAAPGETAYADAFVDKAGIADGFVLGGPTLISDEAVEKIFNLE